MIGEAAARDQRRRGDDVRRYPTGCGAPPQADAPAARIVRQQREQRLAAMHDDEAQVRARQAMREMRLDNSAREERIGRCRLGDEAIPRLHPPLQPGVVDDLAANSRERCARSGLDARGHGRCHQPARARMWVAMPSRARATTASPAPRSAKATPIAVAAPMMP